MAYFFTETARKVEMKLNKITQKRKESSMEELRIRAGKEEIKVSGSAETIERERSAFYQHIKELEEAESKAKAEIIQKMRASMSWNERAKQAENMKPAVMRSCGELQATWKEIARAVKAGAEFKVGDYKTGNKTSDGQAFTMVVTDVTDDYVRFESRDCLGDEVCWNSSGSTENLATSDVMNYLNEKLWNVLPEEMKKVIDPVVRKHRVPAGNVMEYRTALFLPAASEVFDDDNCYGDKGLYKQLEYYKDRRHRMRGSAEGEDTDCYWLASVGSGISALACAVGSYGDAHGWYASDALHVPVCFCIKKS